MNLSKLFPLFVAVLCITAIGVSATTLESSVATDPDEEIDTYEILPIGQGDAIALQEQIEGSDEGSEGGEAEQSSSSSQPESEQSSSQSEATGMGASPPSLLDKLLDFLLSILRFLLAVGVILALGALGYRYRDRIIDALWALLKPTDDPADVTYDGRTWPEESPSNAVEQAWVSLVRKVDPERPSVMTPAECATAARQSGYDAAPVETITNAFERVKYGGVAAEQEEERVEDALQQLDGRRSGVIGSVRRGNRGAGGGGD